MSAAQVAKKAGEEAERIHREVYGEGAAAPKTGEEGDAAGKPPGAAAEPAKKPPTEGSAEHWQHKYATLQGMYNADVPRLNAQVREFRERVANLEQILANMQAAGTPQTRENSFGKLVTQEDIDAYGEDLISVAKRAAKEELGPELMRIQRENEQLRAQNLQFHQSLGNVSATQVKNSRQVMLEELTKAVPDWATVNVDPEFIQWLAEPDAFSGETRQALLLKAFENADAPRVVLFFKKFLAEKTAITGQRQDPTQPSPAVNMDTLVAPGRAQTVATPVNPGAGADEAIWTQAEIQHFYADVQRGKFKNNPTEKQRLEASIMRAVNSGRVK